MTTEQHGGVYIGTSAGLFADVVSIPLPLLGWDGTTVHQPSGITWASPANSEWRSNLGLIESGMPIQVLSLLRLIQSLHKLCLQNHSWSSFDISHCVDVIYYMSTKDKKG
jgi:hypothetical protein